MNYSQPSEVTLPYARRGTWISAHMGVTILLCLLFALMYLDRVNLSAAAGAIKQSLSLSNTEMGFAFSGFSWAYLASVFVGGWGARKFGARAVLVVCVLIVGAGTIATGFAGGLLSLFAARLVVGLGEGPVFPAATQAMRNWYAPEAFGYIQGITHSASRLGGALAPPVVAFIIEASNWTTSFVVLGLSSFLWAVLWLLFFRDDPRSHRGVNPAALVGVTTVAVNAKAKIPFGSLTRKFLPITAIMFAYGWAYWVFVSWLPLYFANQHHLDLKSSALLASVPFLAGVIGNTLSGVVSDALLRRTGSPRLARCSIIAVSLAGAGLLLIPAMYATDLWSIVPMLAASMFFLELTIAPAYAIAMDISPEFSGVGSSFIIAGVACAGIVSPPTFGWLIDLTRNWNVPFTTAIGVLAAGSLTASLWQVRKDS